ncbi:mechanosensitive ion channel family protein [Nitrospira sp. T9]|uniref:mechanosensitive ion channel family protein n=1 Tax=unclassified Nitrospira TaxID=2652172 RepID=UPI003F956416
MDITLWTATLEESFEYSFKLFMAYLPKGLGALMLLGLGILLGKIVEAGTSRVLHLIGVDRLLGGTGVLTLLKKIGSHKTISQIVGLLGFWLVFLLFLISATEALSLALLSETLTGLVHYLPKIGMATLILVLGLLATNFLRDLISVACDSSGIRQGTIIAQTVYIAATLLVLVTAINELGIDTSLLNQIIVILIAGLIAGAALSFGIGSRSAVKNLIAAHYIQPIVRIGEKIQVGAYNGTVTAITPMVVVLDTAKGRVVIPAAQFTEVTSILSPTEG